MIDFINPRSKKTKLSILVGMLSLLALTAGAGMIYQYANEYFQARALAEYNYLPSGDVVVAGLDTKELLKLYQENDDGFTKNQSGNAIIEENMELSDHISPVVAEPENKSNIDSFKQGIDLLDSKPADKLLDARPDTVSKPAAEKIPNYNTLVVPQMGVNGIVYEGQNETTLAKGLWRMPMTSDDPATGNMVITSHRYLRRPPNPNTFYLIDKVKVGDEFYMYWQGNKYNYKVKEIKIINPDQIDILYNTASPQLTLFSCTPLFTSEKRLVVIADLL